MCEPIGNIRHQRQRKSICFRFGNYGIYFHSGFSIRALVYWIAGMWWPCNTKVAALQFMSPTNLPRKINFFRVLIYLRPMVDNIMCEKFAMPMVTWKGKVLRCPLIVNYGWLGNVKVTLEYLWRRCSMFSLLGNPATWFRLRIESKSEPCPHVLLSHVKKKTSRRPTWS